MSESSCDKESVPVVRLLMELASDILAFRSSLSRKMENVHTFLREVVVDKSVFEHWLNGRETTQRSISYISTALSRGPKVDNCCLTNFEMYRSLLNLSVFALDILRDPSLTNQLLFG